MVCPLKWTRKESRLSGETSFVTASSEGQGTEGETTDPEALSKRARNRRRQRANKAKRREEARAAGNVELLLPLVTPKRGREADNTPPSGGRGAKKVAATRPSLAEARKVPQHPLSAPKPKVTVPVAQSTPSKQDLSAPEPLATVPDPAQQGLSAAKQTATVPNPVKPMDQVASAPKPSAPVLPSGSTHTGVDNIPTSLASASQPSRLSRAEGYGLPRIPRVSKRQREPETPMTTDQGPSYAKKAAMDLHAAMDATLLPQFCCEDATSVLVLTGYNAQKVIFCSGYLPSDDGEGVPCEQIRELYKYSRQTNIPVIIGCDANAHHTMWSSRDINRRGMNLAEYIATTNLELANRGTTPTFVNSVCETLIDLTIASPQIFSNTIGWKVSEEETLSDHREINF